MPVGTDLTWLHDRETPRGLRINQITLFPGDGAWNIGHLRT